MTNPLDMSETRKKNMQYVYPVRNTITIDDEILLQE